jgi:hypothetical protein
VQIAESQAAVAVKDGDARRAEPSTPQIAMFGRQGAQGGLAMGTGPATVVVLDPRPQLVAERLEAVEQLDSGIVENSDGSVDLGQIDEEGVAADLQLAAAGRWDVGCHPIEQQ